MPKKSKVRRRIVEDAVQSNKSKGRLGRETRFGTPRKMIAKMEDTEFGEISYKIWVLVEETRVVCREGVMGSCRVGSGIRIQ
jgi:hypothetical protein